MQLLCRSWQRIAVLSFAVLGSLYALHLLTVPDWPNPQQWRSSQLTHVASSPGPPGSSFMFRNASWLPEVGAWLAKCGASSPIEISEHFSNLSCPKECSGRGVCNHELAECRCFHGYNGEACELKKEFECNREHATEEARGNLQFGEWISSMCPATCDKTKAFCYCGEGTKYPQRPVAEQCGFAKIAGTTWQFDWNQKDVDVFSNSSTVNGWCNLDPADLGAKKVQQKHDCFCIYEGGVGDLCEIPVESTCYNQCSGNGVCRGGFCACGKGWHGIDCSIPSQVGSLKTIWPLWLSHGVGHASNESSQASHQLQSHVNMKRIRPLVYVYDLPPKFNSHLMEGRHFKFQCVTRVYNDDNSTLWTDQLYGSEHALLESLLASKHRTMNAEEADFFYVPVLGGCATSRAGAAPHMDTKRDYLGLRVFFSGDLYKQAYKHIREKYTYWNHTNGRDHIWLFPWDEGACTAPKEIWNSVMLVHWGNTNHKHNHSTTGYPADNWDNVPENWRGSHPCYDPEKDIVLPAWKDPDPYSLYMRQWSRPREARPTLFYFRGNLGRKYKGGRPEDKYSMGIRQRLAEEFGAEPNIAGDLGRQFTPDVNVFSTSSENYSIELSSARFCGVFPGDGWSGRMEDSILHGCIPVIIQDGIHLPYENMLDYTKFVVRISEDDLPHMVNILRSIPDSTVDVMQSAIQNLWQRFTYHNAVQLEADRQKHLGKFQGAEWAQQYEKLTEDDAFATLIQVLHYKLSQQTWRTMFKLKRNATDGVCRNYSYQHQG